MKEFIILEIIPTHSKKELGKIIQLQALKIKDMNLIDRFDYRLNEDKITNKDLVNLISYDKDYFKYVNDDKKILKEFSKWSKKLPLLILYLIMLNYLAMGIFCFFIVHFTYSTLRLTRKSAGSARRRC